MSNREVKITWHPKTNKLLEVPSEGLEYALVSPDNRQVHQLVRCKDFIHDVIYSYINKMDLEIYGLTYNPKTSPEIDLKSLKLIITNFKDREFENHLKNNCLSLLHHVEGRLNMKKTKISKCMKAHPVYRFSGVWLLEASSRWMRSIPMTSFYTFLLRIGMVHQPGDTLEQTIDKLSDGDVEPYYDKSLDGGRDQEIIMDAEKGIQAIMKHGDKAIFKEMKSNYPSFSQISKAKEPFYGKIHTSIYDIHDGFGLTAFSQGATKKVFPHWHKKFKG